MPVGLVLRYQPMAAFSAEMRDIDNSRGIIGQQTQYGTRGHGFQAFARFEDGQGAEQPQRIQCFNRI